MVSNWSRQTWNSATVECPQVNLTAKLTPLCSLANPSPAPLGKHWSLVSSSRVLPHHPWGESRPKISSSSTPLTDLWVYPARSKAQEKPLCLTSLEPSSTYTQMQPLGQSSLLAHMKSFQISRETLHWFLFYLCYAIWPSICYSVLPAFQAHRSGHS